MADQLIHPVLPVTPASEALKKKKSVKKPPVKSIPEKKKPKDDNGHVDTYA